MRRLYEERKWSAMLRRWCYGKPALRTVHKRSSDIDGLVIIPGLLKVAEPLFVWEFRKENVGILAELKRYVEGQPKQCDLKTIGTREAP
jgi:hypothetical protein